MKVVIIDDEKAMHLIMKRMLRKIDNIEIAGIFQETTVAFSYLQKCKVDLVFIDINMHKENGLDFAKRLRASGCEMKLVFVTSHKEYALPAFDVYAYDYIVKPISLERLTRTIERFLSEENADIETVAKITPQKVESPLIESLTKRELEIMQLMSNGLTNKEIASTYQLAEGTVKNHIVNIFGKLQVKNRVQATTMAKSFNLIN
ncbi:response regulator transcription factor [Paraliobacillus sediminis]|uniref:response regulator transcription factor n=1 Tax=Paraliobacillus sediminis TaxID=1885916 RepID=UPI000E3D920B|nr:response regulator transcription factor [Paraliobacillus sediminis]